MTVSSTPRDEKLSKDTIVVEALAFADEYGIEKLSIRALAKRLGVDPMALYYYIQNKEALIDHMLNAIFSEVTVPDIDDLGWRESIICLTKIYLQIAHRHPNLFPSVSTHPRTIPASFPLSEKLFEALKRAGLQSDSILQAAEVIVSYVTGYALADIVGSIGKPRSRERLEQDIKRLPEGWLCNLRTFVLEVSEEDTHPNFEFGLNIILNGIESTLQRERHSHSDQLLEQ